MTCFSSGIGSCLEMCSLCGANNRQNGGCTHGGGKLGIATACLTQVGMMVMMQESWRGWGCHLDEPADGDGAHGRLQEVLCLHRGPMLFHVVWVCLCLCLRSATHPTLSTTVKRKTVSGENCSLISTHKSSLLPPSPPPRLPQISAGVLVRIRCSIEQLRIVCNGEFPVSDLPDESVSGTVN